MAAWARIIWLPILLASGYYYWQFHAIEHFIWHLSFGTAAGFVVAAIWEPRRGAWIWPLVMYGFMIVPDLIFLAGRWFGFSGRHAPWMDVFLGHYSLDQLGLVATILSPLAFINGLLAWRRAHQIQASAMNTL